MVKLAPVLRLTQHEKRGLLLAKYPYAYREINEHIKPWPGTRWDHKNKGWMIPECFAERLVDLAQDVGLALKGVNSLRHVQAPLAKSENLLGVFDYQHLFAQRANFAGSRLCSSEMGCGKTPAALEALAELELNKPGPNILVICPGGVRNHWIKQLRKWWPDYFNTVTELVCLHKIDSKLAWQKVHGRGFTITSYDLAAGALDHSPYDAIILDESHHIKNRKTKRSQAVAKICQQNPDALRLALSATPFDRPADLWHQLHLLFPGRYGTWWQFVQRYASCEHNGYGFEVGGLCPDPEPVEELKARLQLVMDRVTKKDIAHLLPPLTVQTESLRAPASDWRAMREGLENAGRAHEDQIEASLLRAGNLKVKRVRTRIEDLAAQGQSVICVTYHRALARDITFGHPDWIYIDGTLSHDERDAKLAEAETTGRPVVATMGSIAEGIDLTFADVAIIAEFTYKSRLMIQTLGRFHRLSSTKPVSLLFFYVEGTWDEVVCVTTEDKIADMSKLLGAGESESVLQAVTTGDEAGFASRLADVAANMLKGDEYL